MSTGATEDFTDEEQAMLDKLREEDAAEQAATEGSTSDAPGDPAAASPPAAPAATSPTSATPAAAAPAVAAAPADPPQGDVRGALRAARRGEARARDEADRLRREVEELKAKVPTQADPDALTDAELHELEQDMPPVAKLAREVKAMRAERAAAPAAPAPTDFEPVRQPVNVQDAIDETPELLAWQNSPDQAAWQLAAQHDAALRTSPAWASKPMPERFAECVRRTQADLGSPAAASPPTPAAPAPPRLDPTQVAAAAPRASPSTLSDIPSGAVDLISEPGVPQFMKMSDDEIIASLVRSTG